MRASAKKNDEKASVIPQCVRLFCFSSFARTACDEQLQRESIASYLKLKIQPNTADTPNWWRNCSERLLLL